MAAITTLLNFNFANGEQPVGSLVEDAAGDLFGTAATTSTSGTQTEQVYEIANTATGYASEPTILATFSGSPSASGDLTVDASGDVFAQTTSNGNATAIYEIAKSAGSYTPPSLIATINGPSGDLILDKYGDLIGTTGPGATSSGVTVYEIRAIGTTYSSSPITLANIPSVSSGGRVYGAESAVVASDSNGNLIVGVNADYEFNLPPSDFTIYGEAGVFEIAQTTGGYASTANLLTSFATGMAGIGYDYINTLNGIVIDSAGDVLGDLGEGSSDDSVFELTKTGGSYATTANFLPSPARSYGAAGPLGMDADGDLYAATLGVSTNYGLPAKLNDTEVFVEVRSSSGTYTEYDLADFNNGQQPNSVLIGPDGALYGTTEYGGAYNDGTFFEIALPSLTVTSLSVASATAELTISGILDIPDPNRPVSIYEGDDLLGTATAAANGAWSATLAQTIAAGETRLDIVATNASGGTASVAVDLFYDTNNQWGATSGGNGAVYLDNAQVSVTAGGASVYLVGSDDWASLYNTSGDWDTVTGDDGSVILTGAQASIFGGGDQIYFNGQSPDAVSLYATKGNWDKATGDDGSFTLVNAQVSVFGGNDTVYFDGSADDAASFYATNGHWDTVYGDDGAVTLNGAQASVLGEGDNVYFAPGTSNQTALYNTHGVADSVMGSNGVVILSSAQSSVSGGSNVLYFLGQDDAADLYATSGDWDTVNATGASVTLHGAQSSVFGGDDTIHFDGSNADATSLYNTSGDWDTVFGDDGAVTLNGAQTSLLGHGDSVYFAAGAHNAVSLYWTYGVDDYVIGSNGSINLSSVQADVQGNGDYLYLNGASTAAMTGANENFVFQAAIGEATIGGFVSSDVIQFSSADFANYQALSGHITQSGDDAVITYDAKDSVTLTNTSASSLTAANFKFA